jgi:PAS domain S-box-containing protein
MDGIQVCRHIRQNPLTVDIPIVMVTALEDREMRLAAIEAGTDDFILKPYDRLELVARVRSLATLNRLRRQRQTELREERDNKLAILNALGEAVAVTDRAGIIQYINPDFTEQTGYSENDAVGRQGYGWLFPTASQTTFSEINEALSKGETWRGEIINQRKDGSFYHAAATIAPMFGKHTVTFHAGIVATFRNITLIKEAHQLKEKFVSNISHEIRTPLSVITLLSGTLNSRFDQLKHEQQEKIIRDIWVQTRVLNGLVENVLQLVHLDHVPITPPKTCLNLARIVAEEVEKQLPLFHKKAQVFSVNGMPTVEIEGNDQQIRQILRNFINNAIKYTPDRGKIEMKCVAFDTTQHAPVPVWLAELDIPDGKWGVFCIEDNGIGISQTNLPYIFGRFFRANPHSALPGAGLGLSIARELIELHGGWVNVQSMENAGTTFIICLPLAQKKTNHPSAKHPLGKETSYVSH